MKINLTTGSLITLLIFSGWISIAVLDGWTSRITQIITATIAIIFLLIDGPKVDSTGCSLTNPNPKFKVLDFPTFKLHYLFVSGKSQNNRTFVIIPDPPCTIEHYVESEIVRQLSELGNVLCVDAPGFGFSFPKNGYSFSWRETQEALEQFLKTINKPNYIFISGCAPALGALLVAQNNPEIVSHMIVMQVSSFDQQKKWAWKMDMKGAISTKIIGQFFLITMKRKITQIWFFLASASKENAKKFRDIAWETQHRGACFCLSSALQKMFYEVNRFPSLKISQPTLVLWGMADKTHRRTNKKSIFEYLDESKVTYEEFEAIGHFPDLEQPKVFLEKLKDFISKN